MSILTCSSRKSGLITLMVEAVSQYVSIGKTRTPNTEAIQPAFILLFTPARINKKIESLKSCPVKNVDNVSTDMQQEIFKCPQQQAC